MNNVTGGEFESASPSVAFDTSTPVKCGGFFAPFYSGRQAFLSPIKDTPVANDVVTTSVAHMETDNENSHDSTSDLDYTTPPSECFQIGHTRHRKI